MPFHDQVKLETPLIAFNEWSNPISSIVDVDAGMQDLIKDIWSLTTPDNGYCRTWASCQGGMMPVEHRLVDGVLVSQSEDYNSAYVMFQMIFLSSVSEIISVGYGTIVRVESYTSPMWPPGWWSVIRFDMH